MIGNLQTTFYEPEYLTKDTQAKELNKCLPFFLFYSIISVSSPSEIFAS